MNTASSIKAWLADHVYLPRWLRWRWIEQAQDADYGKRLVAAKTSGSAEAIQAILQEKSAQEFFEYEENEIAYTKHLVRKARRVRAPLPDYPEFNEENEWWHMSYSLGERYLTDDGIARVREGLRLEERWTIERRSYLFGWVSALTGLIGALIGLVSIWKK